MGLVLIVTLAAMLVLGIGVFVGFGLGVIYSTLVTAYWEGSR